MKAILKTYVKIIIGMSTGLTILISISAGAQNRSHQIDSKTRMCEGYRNIFFVSLNDPVDATCDSFDAFDHQISEMGSMSISNTAPFLGSIVTSNFAGWNWGQENWFTGSISIYLKRNDPLWGQAQKYIFAHEMGHFFLQAYVSERSTVFAELLSLQKQSYQYTKYFLPILALKNSDTTCEDPNSACSRKIIALIAGSPIDLNGPSGDELIPRFKKSNQVQLDRFFTIIDPYHELFADLFAALYADDSDINAKAQSYVGLKAEACRTFSADLGADFQSDNTHCRFSSIRAELWQKLVIPSLPQKRLILMKLAGAIWAEVNAQLASNDKPLDPAIAARNLLNRVLNNNPLAP